MARPTGESSNLSVDADALFKTLEDRNTELQRQTPSFSEPCHEPDEHIRRSSLSGLSILHPPTRALPERPANYSLAA